MPPPALSFGGSVHPLRKPLGWIGVQFAHDLARELGDLFCACVNRVAVAATLFAPAPEPEVIKEFGDPITHDVVFGGGRVRRPIAQ